MINLWILLQMNVAERIEKAAMPYLVGALALVVLRFGGRILLNFLLNKSDPPSRG